MGEFDTLEAFLVNRLNLRNIGVSDHDIVFWVLWFERYLWLVAMSSW